MKSLVVKSAIVALAFMVVGCRSSQTPLHAVAATEGTREAIDDLEVVMDSSPFDPSIEVFFLKNLNTTRSIRATVTKTGNKNFLVDSPDRGFSRQYYPSQVQIELPPGGRRFLGRRILAITTKISWSDGFSKTSVEQRFSLDGAVYVDPARHQAVKDNPDSHIWIRSVPMEGSDDTIMDFALNDHWFLPIEYVLEAYNGNDGWGYTLVPEQQTYFNPSSSPKAYRVVSAKFVELLK